MPIYIGDKEIATVFKGDTELDNIRVGEQQQWIGIIVTPDPSITYVSRTTTSLTFDLTNNHTEPVTIYYGTGNPYPNGSTVSANANSTVRVTLSGLNSNTSYTINAVALEAEQLPSEGSVSFTQSTQQETTQKPTVTSTSVGHSSIKFTVRNNDSSTATIYYELNDSTPDITISNVSPGSSVTRTIYGLNSGQGYTLYVRAQASGKLISSSNSYGRTTKEETYMYYGKGNGYLYAVNKFNRTNINNYYQLGRQSGEAQSYGDYGYNNFYSIIDQNRWYNVSNAGSLRLLNKNLGSYISAGTGNLHGMCQDDTYLYGAGDSFRSVNGKSVTVVKIRKSDGVLVDGVDRAATNYATDGSRYVGNTAVLFGDYFYIGSSNKKIFKINKNNMTIAGSFDFSSYPDSNDTQPGRLNISRDGSALFFEAQFSLFKINPSNMSFMDRLSAKSITSDGTSTAQWIGVVYDPFDNVLRTYLYDSSRPSGQFYNRYVTLNTNLNIVSDLDLYIERVDGSTASAIDRVLSLDKNMSVDNDFLYLPQRSSVHLFNKNTAEYYAYHAAGSGDAGAPAVIYNVGDGVV